MLVSANIFQPLISVFEAVLKFFHNSVGVSWGFSIVLLTVAVRAVLIPLTVKQIKSMQRLQQLQPELKAIQAKYKQDKERQQQEMMRFYKENKVNPLGSCLPLVAQLPVFISLFYMLRQSLRTDICPSVQKAHNHGVLSTAHTVACGPNHGAGFLFISDLTNKATGATLVVLLALYVGSQLAASLMMSSASMDRNQRMIMLVMPLFFVFIFLRYPAGLLVYWISTNTWQIGQQYVVKRRMGPIVPASSTITAGNGSGRSGSAPRATSSRTTPRDGKDGDGNGAAPAKARGNGAGSTGGGLGGLIRGRGKASAEEAAMAAKPAGPPPKSPRKKKKRSGRRR